VKKKIKKRSTLTRRKKSYTQTDGRGGRTQSTKKIHRNKRESSFGKLGPPGVRERGRDSLLG